MVPRPARRPAQTGRRSVAKRTTLTAASVDAASAKHRKVQRDLSDVHADPDRQQPAVAEHTPNLNNLDELTNSDPNEEVAAPPDEPLHNE
jgi:hypothetical protein